MKKSIGITIGVVLGTATIIGSGILIPALYTNNSPGTIFINSSDALLSSNTKATNVTLKDALLGTKKINNGNYVLYFGSEGIAENFKFLYRTNANQSIQQLQLGQAQNRNLELSGDYWDAINFIKNNKKAASEQLAVLPEFVGYIHTVNSQSILNSEKLANDATIALDYVIKNRTKYFSLSEEEKTKINNKYKFVSSICDSGPIKPVLGSSIGDFYTKLNGPFEDSDKTNLEAINWVVYPQNTNYTTEPFKTYIDANGASQYYNNDSSTAEFRDLWTFIKNYPLFANVKDIQTSLGVVVGYKDGKIVEEFSGSFNAPSDGGDGDSSGETQSTRNTLVPEPNAGNSFYQWIKTAYGK